MIFGLPLLIYKSWLVEESPETSISTWEHFVGPVACKFFLIPIPFYDVVLPGICHIIDQAKNQLPQASKYDT